MAELQTDQLVGRERLHEKVISMDPQRRRSQLSPDSVLWMERLWYPVLLDQDVTFNSHIEKTSRTVLFSL